MSRTLRRIAIIAIGLASTMLSGTAWAKPSEHLRSGQHRPSDGEIGLQSRQEAFQQQNLERQIIDLGQSLKDDINVARTTAHDANDRLDKQMAQGFQMLDERIGFIQTLLVLIFGALLAVLGGALLIWRELIKLEHSLGHRLVTVEQKISDIVAECPKRVIGP